MYPSHSRNVVGNRSADQHGRDCKERKPNEKSAEPPPPMQHIAPLSKSLVRSIRLRLLVSNITAAHGAVSNASVTAFGFRAITLR